MKYFPLFLSLVGQSAVVVGGGPPAVRKVRLLRKTGSKITVVAPRVEKDIAVWASKGDLDWVRRGFVAGDVAGAAIVIAATGIAAVDERVSEAARAANIPVNVIDRVDLSTFVTPAIVDRDPVTVAIGTDGTAPVLARGIRARLERELPQQLGRLARFAETFRSAVKAVIPDETRRRHFWERFFEGPVAARVLDGDVQGARERMLSLINRPGEGGEDGSVHIVGAGPGDPELLTIGALRHLENADVVIYDRLVSDAVLELVRRDADRVFVGKSRGRHSRTQSQINELILAHARAGKRVVRLKGGDPFIFGRGGEEVDYLRRHGVQARIVPGITAASGCAAATGIPLTHRDHAQAVTFLTGHAKDGEPSLDWAALARSDHTLVFYMGVSTAAGIARNLIDHGLAPSTPVAVVENGTRPNQKVAIGTLAGIARLIAYGEIRGPAVIIIGEVVRSAGMDALPTLAEAVGSN
jgi:uroporphyrin-III C-methyltransferase/precorrin-2 dehydrogenase/sirohydrochlorin ferrochelatase